MLELTTAAYTALFGVIVFVVGQAVLKIVIEPIQEYREVLGKISYALLFYANVDNRSSPDIVRETRNHLRNLAGQLHTSIQKIPCYNLLALLRVVRKRKDVMAASKELVGWSNSLSIKQAGERDRRAIIANNLDIKSG
jgi:hypothetical protein